MFCMVAHNNCGSLIWNLLHVILLMHRILRHLLDYWKVCAILDFLHMVIIYMLLFSCASLFSFQVFKFVLFCSLYLSMIL